MPYFYRLVGPKSFNHDHLLLLLSEVGVSFSLLPPEALRSLELLFF
jgi:hypothetical protein